MGVLPIFAERFKTLRESAGLKQSEIGEKLGVSRGAISFYENCDRTPDIEFAAKAAVFFGVCVDWLLGLSNVKTTDCDFASVCNYLRLDGTSVKALRDLRQIDNWNEVLSHLLDALTIMAGQKSE